MNENKKSLLNKLAASSLLVGGVAMSLPLTASATVADLGYHNLGTGGEVRADILGKKVNSSPLEFKGEEGKCGEGKCGEGKCGEGKCGEGSCGDGDEGHE